MKVVHRFEANSIIKATSLSMDFLLATVAVIFRLYSILQSRFNFEINISSIRQNLTLFYFKIL
jgi:hypothetical protein